MPWCTFLVSDRGVQGLLRGACNGCRLVEDTAWHPVGKAELQN